MGGKHERTNPHGPVGGRKGPGDVWAEEHCGRKGMYKPRRRKGPVSVELESKDERGGVAFDKIEFQLIDILSTQGKCYPSVLHWEAITLILEVIGVSNAKFEANDFIWRLVDKTHGWLEYIPYHSLCLRVGHALEIKEFVEDYLEADRAAG